LILAGKSEAFEPHILAGGGRWS